MGKLESRSRSATNSVSVREVKSNFWNGTSAWFCNAAAVLRAAMISVGNFALFECMLDGPLVMCAVVWSELGHAGSKEADLRSRLRWLRLQEADFPFDAVFMAGSAHRRYRQRVGQRERTLPDFLIGAYGMVAGHRLSTPAPEGYRSYFPDLDIIAPETRL